MSEDFGLPWWFVAAALVVSAGFVALGVTLVRRTARLQAVRRRGVPVQGTVVAVRTETRRDSDGDTRRVVVPTVRWTDAAEQVHEADVDLPGAHRLSAGDRVDVLYDPQDPGFALAPGGGREAFVAVVAGFFALVGVVVAVAVVVAALR